MSHTRTIRERAVRLRRAGKSYRDISVLLGISKGTLSGWFTRLPWSRAIRRDLERATRPMHRARIAAMGRARQTKFAALRASARLEARSCFQYLARDPLFVAGIALYWGEGDKKVAGGRVRMSNVDPRLLQTFIRFLVTHGGIDRRRLRAGVLIYPDLDARTCVRYWSTTLALPHSQFHATQIIPGRSERRRLEYGVCIVVVGDCLLAERIAEWTRCLHEYLCAV